MLYKCGLKIDEQNVEFYHSLEKPHFQISIMQADENKSPALNADAFLNSGQTTTVSTPKSGQEQ